LDVVEADVASVPEVTVTGVVEKFQGPVPRGEIAFVVNEFTPIPEIEVLVELGRLRAGDTETGTYPEAIVTLWPVSVIEGKLDWIGMAAVTVLSTVICTVASGLLVRVTLNIAHICAMAPKVSG